MKARFRFVNLEADSHEVFVTQAPYSGEFIHVHSSEETARKCGECKNAPLGFWVAIDPAE